MTSFIILAIYIVGVLIAFQQIKHWNGDEITSLDEYQVLFILSMLSWLIYPIYLFAWLISKARED